MRWRKRSEVLACCRSFESDRGEFEFAPVLGKRALLEIQLQRKLNKARITSSLQLTELRCTDFNGNRLDLARRSDRPPERVHVVPQIEEMTAGIPSRLGLGFSSGAVDTKDAAS